MKIQLEAFYRELTPEYLTNRREELPKLSELISSGDFMEIEKKFHKIAGSGGGYGLEQVSKISAQIEKMGREQNLSEIKKSFEEYTEHINSIELVFSS